MYLMLESFIIWNAFNMGGFLVSTIKRSSSWGSEYIASLPLYGNGDMLGCEGVGDTKT